MANFHVLVEWPNNEQPWLVLIEASSKADARRSIETSEAVRNGRGKISSLQKVCVPGDMRPVRAR
jgi:hypothetical protein